MLSAAILAFFLVQTVPAQNPQDTAQPGSADVDTETITIYGRRAEAALTECLARACPPKEDIESSIQVAISQFGAGRYRNAASTLRKAIARNHDHADEVPAEISSLHATLATVLRHEGRVEQMSKSARASVRILRDHIGPGHPNTLLEEIAFGDTLLRRGSASGASERYRHVAETAEAGRHGQIAAVAYLRLAGLAMMRKKSAEADALAAQAVRVSGNSSQVVLAQTIMRLREQVERGDETAVDRLVAALSQQPRTDLILLYAPAYPDVAANPFGNVMAPENPAQLQFTDIGFWVRSDGVVEDVSYLRAKESNRYRKELLAQVAGRRYAPFTPPNGEQRIYRIERVTVRGDWGPGTGSRIPVRGEHARIEVSDLTATQEMADQALAAAASAEAAPTPRTP